MLANPNKLLTQRLRLSSSLEAKYLELYSSRPCTPEHPWSLVVAFDEFVPGNKLRPDNKRKIMILSYNFLELGQAALSDEAFWHTPVIVRHNTIREVVGGWSRMLRDYLRLQLTGASGLATAGVPVKLGGENVLIFARLTNLLADGEGFKIALDWKGASGMKPCFRHYNVLKKGSGLSHRRPGYVEVSSTDVGSFATWQKADLVNAMHTLIGGARRVEAGTLTKTLYRDLEMSYGLNCNPDGLIADRELDVDVISSLTYDWVHSALQDGVLTDEVAAMFRACEPHGLDANDVMDFLKDDRWRYPFQSRAKSASLHEVFSSYRNQDVADGNKLKCSSSELLGLFGMLRHFVETRVAHVVGVERELASFLQLCNCLDIILLAKRRIADPLTAAHNLEDNLVRHLELHKAVYGDSLVKPKIHWLLDIPLQIRRDGLVLDSFVIERHHNMIKRLAEPIHNTRDFERSVLRGYLLVASRTPPTSTHLGLQGRSSLLPGAGVRVADRVSYDGLCVAVDDVVFNGDVAGLVLGCCFEAAEFLLIVDPLTYTLPLSRHSAVYRFRGDELEVWNVAVVTAALAWHFSVDGSLTVVRC